MNIKKTREMTPALRPVSFRVNQVIGDYPDGPFNFGLYYNKWFYVVDVVPDDGWKRPKKWSCPSEDETDVVKKDETCEPNVKLDNLCVAISLFNASQTYKRKKAVQRNNGKYKEEIKDQQINGRFDRERLNELLKERHRRLDACMESMRKEGYTPLVIKARLLSTFITGLGGEHPTEKGFRFEWTLGIPYIPSSSIKGVVRYAFIMSQLEQIACRDSSEADRLWKQIVDGDLPMEEARRVFGAQKEQKEQKEKEKQGDNNVAMDAHRGGVIFLDAYPEVLPCMTMEIMNCHYPDYYQKGNQRGPTEDQNPNPQKFMAVDPYYIENQMKKPVHFIFRFLISKGAMPYRNYVEQAVGFALEMYGLGAKTAVGHGLFKKHSNAEKSQGHPDTDIVNGPGGEESQGSVQPRFEKTEEVWKGAKIEWEKGRESLSATFEGKKAIANSKDLIPESLRNKVLGKKPKSVKAIVTVEVIGERYYKIVKVESLDE